MRNANEVVHSLAWVTKLFCDESVLKSCFLRFWNKVFRMRGMLATLSFEHSLALTLLLGEINV
jgi:hypothetical protein